MEASRLIDQGVPLSEVEAGLRYEETQESLLSSGLLDSPEVQEFIASSESSGIADISELSIMLHEHERGSLIEEFIHFLAQKSIEVVDSEPDDLEPGTIDEKPADIDSLQVYLSEAGAYPLLTAAEEVTLAKKMERGRHAGALLEVHKFKNNLENEEQRHAAQEIVKLDIPPEDLEIIVHEGKQAEKKMTTSNLRLVVSIVKRYRGQGVSFLDLIQEGNQGLFRAVEKFEWRKGFKFSTYATWWIRQAAQRAIANHSRDIRLPVHIHERVYKLSRSRRDLEQQLQRDPTDEELAEETRLSVQEVKELTEVSKPTVSLDKTVGDEYDSNFGDLVADRSQAPVDTEVVNSLSSNMDQYLIRLPERERTVIVMRYGFEGYEPHSLEAIGKRLKITRERVRQIEGQAMGRLRAYIEEDGLTGLDVLSD